MKQQKPTIGGQAVLEGVMMRSPEHMAIAVRKEDGQLVTRVSPVVNPAKKTPFFGWPLVRGVVSFVQSMAIGVKTLSQAADMLGIEEDQPTRFEKALAKATGKKTEDIMMFFAVVVAVALAVGLFIFLPSLAVTAMRAAIENRLLVNMLEGALRLCIFFGYMLLVGLVPDIGRTFAYHGAEHKVVMTYEQDGELTVERCRQSSRFHPRCGTSFLFLVMAISILCFSLLPISGNVFLRSGTRLLLMPFVAGISYEILKAVAKSDNLFTRIVRAPGLWTQRITTREPDDAMIEVAIASFNAALTGQLPEEADVTETAEPAPSETTETENASPESLEVDATPPKSHEVAEVAEVAEETA